MAQHEILELYYINTLDELIDLSGVQFSIDHEISLFVPHGFWLNEYFFRSMDNLIYQYKHEKNSLYCDLSFRYSRPSTCGDFRIYRYENHHLLRMGFSVLGGDIT